MSFVDFKAKAVELVKQAVEQDNAQNYEEALRLYKASLEHFSLHLKYEKNPSAKKTITAKARARAAAAAARPQRALADTGRFGTLPGRFAVHRVPGARGGAAEVRGVCACAARARRRV